MSVVDFGTFRKLASGGAGLVTRAARDFYQGHRRPGPDITSTPFEPGSVSTGAIAFKLATAIAGHARKQANFEAAQRTLETKRAEDAAQIDLIRSQTGYYKSRAALADAGAETPKPRAKIKLSRDIAGYKAGAEVDPEELRQAAGIIRTGIRERGLKNRSGNRSAYNAAQAVLTNVRNRLDPQGRYALEIEAIADRRARGYVGDLMSRDAKRVAAAREALGVQGGFDQTKLTSAVDAWKQSFRLRELTAEARKLDPQRIAAEAVTASEAGLDAGMSPDEEALLRSVDEEY